MTEVIFGDLDSPEDFYKSLKEMQTPPKPTDRSKALKERWFKLEPWTKLINIRVDGSWLIIHGRGSEFGYMFENKTWNETKRELSFTVKFTEYSGEKKFLDETDNDMWDDLTRAVWRNLDYFMDWVPCSIEIPKFGWHIPSAKDTEARVAYIVANGRKPPPTLAPPKEVEKPEPAPARKLPSVVMKGMWLGASPESSPEPPATYSCFDELASASSPLFDRRRPPPELPPKRTPSKPRKTRTSMKAAEAAAVAVDDD